MSDVFQKFSDDIDTLLTSVRRATGQSEPVKWKAGDVLVRDGYPDWRVNGDEAKWLDNDPGYLAAAISLGWRLAEQPAAPVERQLAPGWTRDVKSAATAHFFGDPSTMWECTGCDDEDIPAMYAHPDSEQGACSSCAEAMGVFADAPTIEDKPSAPVCKEWCGKVDMGICLSGDDETCYGGTSPSCFCSPGCRDADRPLNPAVRDLLADAQPIGVSPAGSVPFATNVVVDYAVKRILELVQCTKCAHRHVGPCDGASPSGEYGCPCGHVAAKAPFVRTVGRYGDNGKPGGAADASLYMRHYDSHGPTATILANLARERPPAREIVVPRRYLPGANLDE